MTRLTDEEMQELREEKAREDYELYEVQEPSHEEEARDAEMLMDDLIADMEYYIGRIRKGYMTFQEFKEEFNL